jgi:hypothetical protein
MDGQTLPCFLFAFEGAFESGLREPIFGVLQTHVLLLEQGAWLQATKQMALDPSAFPYGCRSARATMCARCPGSHCDLSWSFEGFCLSILAVPERYASGFLRSASALRVLITPQFVRRLLLQAAASTLARIA